MQPAADGPGLPELVAAHMERTGQDRAAFCQALEIRNHKAVQAFFDRLGSLDMAPMKHHRRQLARVLGLPLSQVESARHRSAQRRAARLDAAWRAAFVPHALLVTRHKRPTQIVIAALAGADRMMRVALPLSASRLTWPAHVQARLPRGVPGFGRVTGFVINYDPDHAVRFDLAGQPVDSRDAALRMGAFRLSREAGQLGRMLDD